jgi:hypothetical protein
MTNENDRCDKFDINEHNIYVKCSPSLFDVGVRCSVHKLGKFTPAPQASQPPTASMEALVQEGYALVTSAIGKPETQYRMDLKEYIQKLDTALQATPAATEGERCDAEYTQKLLCEYPENHTGYHSWWELLKRQQPTETVVTG